MDWTTFFASIGGALTMLGGVSLIKVMTPRLQIRRERSEVKRSEIDNLQQIIEVQSTKIDQLTAEIESLKIEIETLRTEKRNYEERTYWAENLVCLHKGCRLRKPDLGAGYDWWAAHHDDGNLDCDTLTVEELLGGDEVDEG